MSDKEMRFCKICGVQKILEEDFPSNGSRMGGYRWQCKECMNKKNKEYRKKNREKIERYNASLLPKEPQPDVEPDDLINQLINPDNIGN